MKAGHALLVCSLNFKGRALLTLPLPYTTMSSQQGALTFATLPAYPKPVVPIPACAATPVLAPPPLSASAAPAPVLTAPPARAASVVSSVSVPSTAVIDGLDDWTADFADDASSAPPGPPPTSGPTLPASVCQAPVPAPEPAASEGEPSITFAVPPIAETATVATPAGPVPEPEDATTASGVATAPTTAAPASVPEPAVAASGPTVEALTALLEQVEISDGGGGARVER